MRWPEFMCWFCWNGMWCLERRCQATVRLRLVNTVGHLKFLFRTKVLGDDLVMTEMVNGKLQIVNDRPTKRWLIFCFVFSIINFSRRITGLDVRSRLRLFAAPSFHMVNGKLTVVNKKSARRWLIFGFALSIINCQFLISPAEGESAAMIIRSVFTIGGSVFGGPIGGLVGGLVGGLLSNFLFPPKPQQIGPRLASLEVVAAEPGEQIRDSMGTIVLPGILIDSSDLHETKHKVKAGKGFFNAGPSGFYFTYSVDCRWLLRRREAAGVMDVWLNAKKVRDISATASLNDIIASHFPSGGGTLIFYLGAEDQLPDPTMEALHGVGQVPAHRNVVTVVAKALQLADFGSNQVPQLAGEVYDIGDEGLKNFGALNANADGMGFNVWQTWDYVDDNGEVISLVLNTGWGAAGFATYVDPIRPLAYQWQRMTPDGVFPEEKLFLTGQASGRILGPTSGKTDEAATVAPSSGGISLFRYKEQIENFMPWNPSGNQGITRWIYKDGKFYVLLNNHFGVSNGQLAEYDPASGLLLKFTEALVAQGISFYADMDASTDFIYVVDQTNLFKISRDTFLIDEIITLAITPGDSGETISVVDDDEMYISSQVLGTDPVNFYRLTDGGHTVTFIGSATGAFTNTGMGLQLLYSRGVLYYGNRASSMWRIALTGLEDGVPLSFVVGLAQQIAGVPVPRYDVSELIDIVHGTRRDTSMTMAEFIRPLMPHFFFDCVESEGKLKWPKRGKAPVFTIPYTDLAAYEDKTEVPDAIASTLLDPRKLPAIINVEYLQKDKDYETGKQSEERILTEYRNVTDFKLVISMTDDEARQTAARLMAVGLVEQRIRRISLTRKYIEMEAGDVFEIQLPS